VDAPRIRRLAELGPQERERLLQRSLPRVFDAALWASIRGLYDEVARDGDAALCRALARFDRVQVEPDALLVDAADLASAGDRIAPELREAIDAMLAALRAYNQRILRDATWREELSPGWVVGERAVPIASAALYVPCGKGSFPSVMAHVGAPAVVAGVPELIVLCPPVPGSGEVDPAVLYAAHRLGLQRVYRVNGPSGIAAAALGTERVPKVRKVVGPGSPAVTVAQLLAQEHGVVTNVLQGPSESLVLADDSADAELLAADLVTEAEHGPDSAATLVTWSEPLAQAAAEAVRRRIEALPEPYRSYAASSLSELGGILLVGSEDEGCRFADAYAVEHLQIATRDVEATLAKVRWASEILLGQDTPMAAANFTIGVPNTLPSGGFAQVSSGVTVRTFLATSSIAQLDAAALRRAGGPAKVLAQHEGFPAHEAALEARGIGR
jgi:histidinol dehydrogenase